MTTVCFSFWPHRANDVTDWVIFGILASRLPNHGHSNHMGKLSKVKEFDTRHSSERVIQHNTRVVLHRPDLDMLTQQLQLPALVP